VTIGKARVVNIGDRRNTERCMRLLDQAIDACDLPINDQDRRRLHQAWIEQVQAEGLVLTWQAAP
jgi:hypothetical protein